MRDVTPLRVQLASNPHGALRAMPRPGDYATIEADPRHRNGSVATGEAAATPVAALLERFRADPSLADYVEQPVSLLG